MGWQDLIGEQAHRVLPWVGSPQVHSAERTWKLKGRRPKEHGWYTFDTSGGRVARLVNDELQDAEHRYEDGQFIVRGYLVGDRLIPDHFYPNTNPSNFITMTVPIFIVEPGLDRFTRAVVVRDRDGQFIFLRQEFPQGPEQEVLEVYQDRKVDLSHIKGVTPGLELAFRWIIYQRELAEERRRELERLRVEEEAKRAAEERHQQALERVGTAKGRRVVAVQDFEMAAAEALRISGSELLDARDSFNKGEKVVQYLFRERRLECVIDSKTLRVIDSGICLEDHDTGVKGDTWLTLESLPGVVGEAMNLGKLVVWRHIDDRYREDDW